MAGIKLKEFGGMMPAWNDRFLPDGQASFAQNCYLYSGALNGWRQPKLLRSLTNGAAKYAYRVPNVSQGIAQANLLFVSQPNPGDTVTVGEIVYTFVTTPVNPYDVLIGPSSNATCQNLYTAIVFGQQDTAICGPGTAPNPAIALNNPYLGNPWSITSATTVLSANNLALQLVRPSGTQLLNNITFMPASTAPLAKFYGVIYNNIAQVEVGSTIYENQPGTLIEQTSQVIGCQSGVPLSMPFPTPLPIIGGSLYWIGLLSDTDISIAQASPSTNSITVNTIVPTGYTGIAAPPVKGKGPKSGPNPGQ